jgi:predicted  nucleic acid-binding Zn-ribbon protein
VALRVCEGIDTPLAFGWIRPVILLPAALVAGMDPRLLEALLAHELAHVRRFDYLVNLGQTAVETLLFYHPGVWWISRRIRIERELIADEIAAGTLGEPRRLALALTELDAFRLRPTQLAQGAHGGNLMHRIKRLIQPEPRPMAWKALLAAAGIATLCAGTAAALGARPAPQGQKAAPAHDLDFAIVTKEKEGITRSGPGGSDKELRALQAEMKDDFLYFRRKGAPYVVTDPATVARAQALYKPMETLGQEMGQVGREMGEVGRHQGEIGRQQGDVGRVQGDIGRQQGEIGRRMGEIGAQQGRIGVKIDALERKLDSDALKGPERDAAEKRLKELEATMKDLDTQMEALEVPMKELEKKMEEASRPMEDLGRRMEEASKPMKDLEAKMKVLSTRMEALSKVAETDMRKLIEESLAKGLARPRK